jgi:hypothetical protein
MSVYADAIEACRKAVLERAVKTTPTRSAAARALGIQRTYLYRLCQQHGVALPPSTYDRSASRRGRRMTPDQLVRHTAATAGIMSPRKLDPFQAVADDAVAAAGKIECSISEYVEGLELIIEELHTALLAAKEDLRRET